MTLSKILLENRAQSPRGCVCKTGEFCKICMWKFATVAMNKKSKITPLVEDPLLHFCCWLCSPMFTLAHLHVVPVSSGGSELADSVPTVTTIWSWNGIQQLINIFSIVKLWNALFLHSSTYLLQHFASGCVITGQYDDKMPMYNTPCDDERWYRRPHHPHQLFHLSQWPWCANHGPLVCCLKSLRLKWGLL